VFFTGTVHVHNIAYGGTVPVRSSTYVRQRCCEPGIMRTKSNLSFVIILLCSCGEKGRGGVKLRVGKPLRKSVVWDGGQVIA